MWQCPSCGCPLTRRGRLQTLFRRAQLKALVDVHGQTAGLGGNLSVDEVQVIRGALDLTHKTAIDCMTPLDKVQHLGSILWFSCTQSATVHGLQHLLFV